MSTAVQQAPAKSASWSTLKPTEKRDSLKEIMSKYVENFDLLLQRSIDPKVFIYAVINSAQKNPAILNCTKESILRCAIFLAQVQLMPDTPENHAHLIPFGKECTVIINYQGYIELAHRSNQVGKIWAELVYENDEFEETLGSDPKLIHKPCRNGDRGQMIGAYSVAKLLNGEVQWIFMDMGELSKIRSQSKAKNSPAWAQWATEMHRKAPVRRLHKFIPTSPQMAMAVALDNAATMGERQSKELPLPADFEEITEAEEETTTTSDDVADKIAANGQEKSSDNGGNGDKPKRPPLGRVKRNQMKPQPEKTETEPPAEEPKKQEEAEPEKAKGKPEKPPEPDNGEKTDDELRVELLELVTANEENLGPEIVRGFMPDRVQRWTKKALEIGLQTVKDALKNHSGKKENGNGNGNQSGFEFADED